MDQKVHVALSREDAEVALLGLREVRLVWVRDVQRVGGKTTPTPYDDAIDAIATQLRALDAGEGE